jgi:CubicO group peptidase (beta-lactamase class C family)
MSKKNWYIGGIAILLFMVIGIYFFFPSDSPVGSQKQKEKKVSFLEVDSQWADSLLKTLSIKEKAAMLIMYQPNPDLKSDSAFLIENLPGAYLISSKNILASHSKIKNQQSLVLANFDQLPVTDKVKFLSPKDESNTIFGNLEIFFSLNNDSIRREANSIIKKSADFYSLDGIILPTIGFAEKATVENKIFKNDSSSFINKISDLGRFLTDEQFLTGTIKISNLDPDENKNSFKDSIIAASQRLSKNQFPIIFIDSSFVSNNIETNQITNYLKSEYKFSGLCISFLKAKDFSDSKKIKSLLLGGSDLLATKNFQTTHTLITNLVSLGELKENLVNAKVKKILLAKTWSKLRRKRATYEPTKVFSALDKSFPRRIRKASFVLIKNSKNILPIRNVTNNRIAVVHLGHQPKSFTQNIYYYLPNEQNITVKTVTNISDHTSLNANDYKKYNTVILTINADLNSNTGLLEKINLLSQNSKLIILNFQFPENLPVLSKFSTIIQCWGNTVVETDFSAQAIFGAVTMNARLPFSFHQKFNLKKSASLTQSRLQYTIPEDIGIASDSLLKISYIVEEGIRNKAFPGAQVFFAMNGMAFYNHSFGTHTYADKQEVKTTDLFDMASVTKVAASTIVAMSTYEKGLYKLNDSLHKHLPDTLKKHIHGKSTLRNITFKQILIHATGLASGQPIIRYIRYRDSLLDKKGRFDRYYCDYSDDYYKIKVAEDFYMEREQADTIWYSMNRMSVDEIPSYRYSDANMNLLYKLLNAKIKNRWQYYLDSLFYKPLGMFNTFYLPIENEIKPERIVPTENDRYWRKQLLRGYVHDPTAALFGGVAGNAGLFSTAEDIGILFQMLMYKGVYGGNNYFKKETVELFISQQSGSHRGLGFNRQVKGNTYGVSPFASNNTFGHTGFTGISVWADMDINLLYVSCTNRVHPDAENKKIINLGTTKRIHNVIYEQLEYIMPNKIDLDR